MPCRQVEEGGVVAKEQHFKQEKEEELRKRAYQNEGKKGPSLTESKCNPRNLKKPP